MVIEKQSSGRYGQPGSSPKTKRYEERFRPGEDRGSYYIILLMCSVLLIVGLLYGMSVAGQAYPAHSRLHAIPSVKANSSSKADDRFTDAEDSSSFSSEDEHEPDCLKGTKVCDVKGLRFSK